MESELEFTFSVPSDVPLQRLAFGIDTAICQLFNLAQERAHIHDSQREIGVATWCSFDYARNAAESNRYRQRVEGIKQPLTVEFRLDLTGKGVRFTCSDEGLFTKMPSWEPITSTKRTLAEEDRFEAQGKGLHMVADYIHGLSGEVGCERRSPLPGARFWYEIPQYTFRHYEMPLPVDN